MRLKKADFQAFDLIGDDFLKNIFLRKYWTQ
jgi:hypothetical protein